MFDFSEEALESGLPVPGTHQATITRVNVTDHGDVTYLAMDLELDDGNVVSDIRTIRATPKSGRQEDARLGVEAVRNLATALGVDPKTLKRPNDIDDAFLGGKVAVKIEHGRRGGIKTAKIKGFAAANKLPPKTETKP